MSTISVSRIYDGLFKIEEWNVGIIQQPISNFLKSNNKPNICWLPTPDRGKFLADPFGLIRDKRIFILCEEFDYSRRKGRIVSYAQSDGKTFSEPRVAIDLPIHMSYPYLLESEGEVYCIPETLQAREISLYRADDFPYRWTKVATMVKDFAGVDPTIFEYEGQWWLTCSRGGSWTDLFVWFASDLMGQWKPHAANPVKRDITSSRPAGTPFVYEGRLYRPAQDCLRSYGGRVVLNRIVKLTTEEFEEERVITVEPSKEPYLDGLHTISSVGDMTLIDGKRRRFVATISELKFNLVSQRHSTFIAKLAGRDRVVLL
jgi:hypothetical protein